MAMLNNKMVDIAVVFMGVLDRLVTGHHGAPSCIFFCLEFFGIFWEIWSTNVSGWIWQWPWPHLVMSLKWWLIILRFTLWLWLTVCHGKWPIEIEVYLLKMVIFHGELLVISRWYYKRNHPQMVFFLFGLVNYNSIRLLGGLEPWNFMTFHSVGNFIKSQLTNSYFSEGWAQPPTRECLGKPTGNLCWIPEKIEPQDSNQPAGWATGPD